MLNINDNAEPIFRRGLIKEYFRLKHSVVLLTFPIGKCNDVINILTKYSELFISLEMGDIGTLAAQKDINILTISDNSANEDIIDIVDNLFNSDYYTGNSSGAISGNNESVYAVMFEVCHTDKTVLKEIGFEYMLERLPKEFYVKGIKWIDNCLCQVEFSDIKRYRKLQTENKPVAVIITEGIGSGDFFMIYPYIDEFIRTQKELGNDVHILTVKDSGLYSSLTMYDKGYKVFGSQICHISARFYEIIMKSGYYAECYCISMNPFKFPGKVMHITDMWAIELGIKEDFDYFGAVERDSLLPKCLPNTSNKEFIDKITGVEGSIVGVQLHTMSQAIGEGKNWLYQNIIEFADMARNNGITLLNLSPTPYGEIAGITDVSFLKKNEVFYLISKLDAVIGVDSFCGHMAALLGIPNITIWARQYPDILNPYDQYCILRSYRPLRMNYSIATRTLNSADIKPELVFRRLKEIIAGDITLSNNRISAEDTSAGMCVEIVS